MEIFKKEEAKIIREKYIDSFIIKNQYYNDNIKKLKRYSDGMCYFGYLWECFKQNAIIINYEQFLQKKMRLLFFGTFTLVKKSLLKIIGSTLKIAQ